MRFRILVIALLTLPFHHTVLAQKGTDFYSRQWAHIDSLIHLAGLPNDAMKRVQTVQKKALTEKKLAEQIRCLLYIIQIREIKQEDAYRENISMLEKMPLASDPVLRSVQQHYLARLYLHYYLRNAQVVAGPRTTQRGADIKTWSPADFHDTIRSLMLSSLKPKKILQKTFVEKWHSVLSVHSSTRHLRPTLYDLLAAEALDYFKMVIEDGSHPISPFTLSSPEYLQNASIFCEISPHRTDTLSAMYLSIRLYQSLLSFHHQENNSLAEGDIDLERIQFVYEYGSFPQKDSLYLSALETFIHTKPHTPMADEARFKTAEWYVSNASRNGKPAAEYLARAKKICEGALAGKEPTIGSLNCRSLLERIQEKSIYFLAEKVNVPEQPFRILVTYKNTDRVYFRLVPLETTEAVLIKFDVNYQEKFWEKWAERSSIRNWSEPLPDGQDLLEHKVEIKVDAIPKGAYILLASSDSAFTPMNNQMALQIIHISSIGWIRSDNNMYIVDRWSGYPTANASVQIWSSHFRYETGNTDLQKMDLLTADSNGRVELNYVDAYPLQHLLEIRTSEDHLFLENEVQSPIVYHAPENKQKQIQGFLYTDRSIYRPQQVVYFKGLVTGQLMNAPPQPETSFASTVYLIDPTGSRIDSVFLTTSGFGSYSGRFTLPRLQLSGIYLLWDTKSYAQASFRVEAYKRPRFEVRFRMPTEAFDLNDSVTLQGEAVSFYGGTINNAKVTYTIKRRRGFGYMDPSYVRSGRRNRPSNMEQLIAYGTSITQSDGQFQIRFKAADAAFSDNGPDLQYDFDVQADITDIQGETQSGFWTLPVGRRSLQLRIEVPDEKNMNDLGSIRIWSQNYYGAPVAALLQARVFRLTSPTRPVKKRLWEAPDRFNYSENAFKKWFPHDEYANETDPTTWKHEQEIINRKDSSLPSGHFFPHEPITKPGWYLVKVDCMDSKGNLYTTTKIFRKEDAHSLESPVYDAAIRISAQSLEPEDTLNYSLISNMDHGWQLTTISCMDQYLESTGPAFQRADTKQIKIRDQDRGGLYLTIGFYRYNRFHSDNKKIEVPFSNKALSVHYSSFRELSSPGMTEHWKLRIKNNKNTPVNAELTSTLYDASLDQFAPHRWFKPGFWMKSPPLKMMLSDQSYPLFPLFKDFSESPRPFTVKTYEALLPIFRDGSPEVFVGKGAPMEMSQEAIPVSISGKAIRPDEDFYKQERTNTAAAPPADATKKQVNEQPVVALRKDFRETAFFLPHAMTDSNGEIDISFRMPDALGRWRWMNLAHTKDLSLGYSDTFAITRKPLMAQANAPRFVREGDRMDYPVKISNSTDKELTGQIQLMLIDAETGESVDGWFQNFFPNQYFTVPPAGNMEVSFTMEIPYRFNKPVLARVIARTASFSDGEEQIIPVLSNRMMITESTSFSVNGREKVELSIEKLLQSGQSPTLHHHALTFEYTSNPFWYAVQNLPYLASIPDESADQTYLRFFANKLSYWLLKKTPGIEEIIKNWIKNDSLPLPSALERSEALTQTLLEETPWVLEARSARSLYNKMIRHYSNEQITNELQNAAEKLIRLQNTDGSFSWFSGGPANLSITLQILTGLARLQQIALLEEPETLILQRGLQYLDRWIKYKYTHAAPSSGGIPDKHIIAYLYLRSFFPAGTMADSIQRPYHHYFQEARMKWNQYNKRMQGMIALTCFRNNDGQTAKRILTSLRQNALVSKENGMYWKEFNTAGYAWDETPIESHTLLMYAFQEILKTDSLQRAMKTWLIRQKQTQHWTTSAATAEACLALLQDPSELQEDLAGITVRWGSLAASPVPMEAGTGYTLTVLPGNRVTPSMGNVEIQLDKKKEKDGLHAWGAIHWQYMDELDRITEASGPLSIRKTLFIERGSDRGVVLEKIPDGAIVHTGDKVVVRLEVRSERTLEFVHLKDMRAATLEPAALPSSHQWRRDLYYYQSNKDAGMHFYFDRLPRGTHIFDYTVYVQQKGSFQNGIASIQCLYAPAFNAHTSSLQFHVE